MVAPVAPVANRATAKAATSDAPSMPTSFVQRTLIRRRPVRTERRTRPEHHTGRGRGEPGGRRIRRSAPVRVVSTTASAGIGARPIAISLCTGWTELGQDQAGHAAPLVSRLERVGPSGECHQAHGPMLTGHLVDCPERGGDQSFEFGPPMDPDPIVEHDGYRGTALTAELAHEPGPVADHRRPVEEAETVTGHVGTDALEFTRPAPGAGLPVRLRSDDRRRASGNRLVQTNRGGVDHSEHDWRGRARGSDETERVVGPGPLGR